MNDVKTTESKASPSRTSKKIIVRKVESLATPGLRHPF